MKNKINETLEAVESNFNALKEEASKLLDKGNKSAATRARNNAMAIAKDMKELRALISEFKNSL